MSAFVLDCSVTVAWLIEGEARPETDTLLERLLGKGGALVPDVWGLELGNVLVQAEKRGRITHAHVTIMLEFVGRLPITMDGDGTRALKEVRTLARVASLTTSDAAYLELAMRRGIPLATLDKTLLRAAQKVRVKTLPA